jgi:hypothetical protein
MAKSLEIEKMRLDDAFDTAGKIVTTLRPDADEEVRVILIQTFLPPLLQLGTCKGIELLFPVYAINKAEDNQE